MCLTQRFEEKEFGRWLFGETLKLGKPILWPPMTRSRERQDALIRFDILSDAQKTHTYRNLLCKIVGD